MTDSTLADTLSGMGISLDSRRAVVTGGAGGLGLVVAEALAGAGAATFVCDIDSVAVGALPSHLHGAVVDVADAEAVAAWLDPIAADGVDVLVNLAGAGDPPHRWRRSIPKSGEDVWRYLSRGSSIAPAGWFRP